MSLNSHIVATSPMTTTQIEQLFHHCRQEVAGLPGARRWGNRRDLTWRHGTHWKPSNNEFEVNRGQAPLHLTVVYGANGRLADLDSEQPYPAGAVADVQLDSAGRDSNPRNHAAIIRAAVTWLTEHRITCQWRHEDHPWKTGLTDLARISKAA